MVKRYEELPEAPVATELVPPGKTGLWRTMAPSINRALCSGCGTCWIYCPERAIKKAEGGYAIDYDYCKGCGICAEECPRDAIEMREEA